VPIGKIPPSGTGFTTNSSSRNVSDATVRLVTSAAATSTIVGGFTEAPGSPDSLPAAVGESIEESIQRETLAATKE
jgi:hypothetical protein